MKFQLILKTYVHYLGHRFIYQKENGKTRVHIFVKVQNTDSCKKENFFLAISFQKFLIFHTCFF